jgi:hypothetical protein
MSNDCLCIDRWVRLRKDIVTQRAIVLAGRLAQEVTRGMTFDATPFRSAVNAERVRRESSWEQNNFGGTETMADNLQARRRLLAVVTVVFNDLGGLRKTLTSVQRLLGEIEYLVIDGSTNGDVRDYIQELGDERIQLVSEPDEGLYDAMNKGFDRAGADFVLFLNAGDIFQETFDPTEFLAGSDRQGRIVLGYCVERHDSHRFLRPALGREQRAFLSPAHPATAYPRIVYDSMRFDLSQPIKADGQLTGAALKKVGGVFVQTCVSEFELGGRSSSYGDHRLVIQRLRDSSRPKETIALIVKWLLWKVLPRGAFYSALAHRKYDQLHGEDTLPAFSVPGVVAATMESSAGRS